MKDDAPLSDRQRAMEVVSGEMPCGELPRQEREMLSGSDRRMARTMWLLGVAGALMCLIAGGWRLSGGFVIGAALSSMNFRLIRKGASRITASPAAGESPVSPRASTPGTVALALRFVFRYALIGLAGYVIYKSSVLSMGAFCAGLFLFLGALLAEAVYELRFSLRQPK